MSMPDNALLDAVFGANSSGDTPLARAQSSGQRFARSLDQIAFDSDAAMGRKLTAVEALAAYGWEVLAEVGAEGAALLCAGPKAAGNALRARRQDLGLAVNNVARRAGVPTRLVERAEQTDPDVPLKTYETIGRALCLDERFLSVQPAPAANQELAVRLRTASADDDVRLTPSVVSGIADAAWVAMTQFRLQSLLGISGKLGSFDPNDNYGSRNYPAFEHGYYLAREARKILGLGDGPLPHSLREICENILGIPLLQAELGEQIAGATIQISPNAGSPDAGSPLTAQRAIVLNISGRNRNVNIRRATLAHELGHLLYDPSHKLDLLRVDDYDDMEKEYDQVVDRVEQRANAFGVEFIAPQVAVCDAFRKAESDGKNGVKAVMDRFGIGFTAARYHIWNVLERDRPLAELVAQHGPPLPEWEALETYTLDYHPIPSLPPTRAGRFSAVVVKAARAGAISWDSAAEYLITSADYLREQADVIEELLD